MAQNKNGSPSGVRLLKECGHSHWRVLNSCEEGGFENGKSSHRETK